MGAAMAYAALAWPKLLTSKKITRMVLLLAWLLHAGAWMQGFLLRPVYFGFGPAISMMVWLVLTVYALESRWFPQLQVRWQLAVLGSIGVLLGWVFPGRYEVISSPWLPLHWALGMASYGLFGAAVVHGWLLSRSENAVRHASPSDEGVPLLTLERLTFRFVEAGFFFLSVTLFAGWLFAHSWYGDSSRLWWNHKTIFSALSWLTFGVLLVGRARFGWRGKKALYLLYLGAIFLFLGYVGVLFVLEVMLGRA